MTNVISGHGQGLLDSSLGQLPRRDTVGAGSLGRGVEAYANVANGNLLVQERDGFLPSNGLDFGLVRTYNSRGLQQGSPDGWYWSTTVLLSSHTDTLADGTRAASHEVSWGDGSVSHFDLDAATGTWRSTDGAGAHDQLRAVTGNPSLAFVLTRNDGSTWSFDTERRLARIVDANGVAFSLTYNAAGRIATVRDDTAHVIVYRYDAQNRLVGIDEQQAGAPDVVLARYAYTGGRLSKVTDRAGHETTYTYDAQGLLAKVSLPAKQVVDGVTQTFEAREIAFTYVQVTWNDNPHRPDAFDTGREWVLDSITDPGGNVTRFEYAFDFGPTMAAGDRDLAYANGASRFFRGGTTRVIDALGRASSYTVDADGYLVQVTDAQGAVTRYTWGGRADGDAQTPRNQDNLLSVTDRNGFLASRSNDAAWRAVRRDLGIVDAAGNGKLAAQLSAAERQQITDRYTTRYTYDERGNRLTETDGLGQRTTRTYTAFDKVASSTSPMGHALATLDTAEIRARRVELGFPGPLAAVSAAQADALRALHTTTYAYDAKQNLATRTDPGGDQTLYAYDAFGNLASMTEVLSTTTATLNRVTRHAYDAQGNLTSTIDPEGHTRTRTYDAFGNLLTVTDGRGGLTRYTWDADNRLLSTTDPEGNVTLNRYDAVGNRIAIIDAAGKTVTQVYDRDNLLVATIDPGALAADTRTTTFRYDVVGNRTEVVDAEGRRTVYSFDANRQLVQVRTSPVRQADDSLASVVTRYAYDGEGRVLSTTDGNGHVTQNAYTATGLLQRVTDAGGNVTEYLYDANGNRLQVTVGAQLAPALRRVLRFGYDEENQLVRETDALGGSTARLLDAVGNVVAVTDANGHRTDYAWDRNGRLLKETRPLLDGQAPARRATVLHQYDANGNEVATTDENGNTTRYSFDRADRLVMVSDANGVETVYAHDTRSNVTSVSIGVQATLDAQGKPVITDRADAQVTTYVYDEFSQLVASTDGVGNALAGSDAAVAQAMRRSLGLAALVAGLSAADRDALQARYTQRWAYDRVGNRVRHADHLGNVTADTHDALNRLESRTEALGSALARTSTWRHDANGNVVRAVDGLGRVSTFTYDAMDRLLETTDALGIRTRTERDHVGNVVTRTENVGVAGARRTRYVHDLNDRLLRETDALGRASAYEYDAVGNRLKLTDAKGQVTRYVYDARNRLLRTIDPLGLETRTEYDAVGNQITLVDARGGLTRLTYDPVHRLIRTTDAAGRVTRLAYDVLGRVVTRTTAFGTAQAQVTRYQYDAEGHLRSTTDAAGNVEQRRYDDGYALTEVRDARGNTTTYGWDALRRQVRVTDALGGVTAYAYDAADNVLTETDALGRVRRWAYDAGDRVITETDALGVQTSTTYDAFGMQLTVVRAANRPEAARTTYAYDAGGRLVRETDALGGVRRWSYDERDNVASITDAAGRVTRYVVDALDRVVKVVDPMAGETVYAYDANGNRVLVRDARGATTTTYYNADDEAVLVVDALGYATAREYDANGNLVRERHFMTPLALPVDPATLPTPVASAADRITSHEHDALNRVVRRVDPMGGSTRYAYDAVGNVVTQTDPRGNATTSTYDANNRLVKRADALGQATTYAYDALGNRTGETDARGGVTTYAYDANNRLVRETDAVGTVTEHQFDAMGREVRTIVAGGTPDERVTETRYDGAGRVIDRVDALGIVTHDVLDAVGNVLERHEAWGRPEQRRTAYSYDALDRVATLTDAAGIVTRYAYDGAGNKVSQTLAAGRPEQRVETFQVDLLDRLVRQVNGEGNAIAFEYDGAGNRTRVVIAPGTAAERSRAWEYDRNDRLAAEIDGLGMRTEYRYDAAGNRVEIAQAVNRPGETRRSTYAYDELGRLVRVTDPMGGISRFTYDALGNQTRIVTAGGHVTLNTWDAAGRLATSIAGADDGRRGVKTANAYDALGRLVRSEQSYADGSDLRVTTYAWDDLGRQTVVTDGEGFSTRFTYDAFGNQVKLETGLYLPVAGSPGHDPAKAVRAKVVSLDHAYDRLDRLLTTVNGTGGVVAATYDALGNRLTQTTRQGGNREVRTVTFTYDRANRLIGRSTPGGGRDELAYDAAGNQVSTRVLQSGSGASAVWSLTTTTYDGNGRVVDETGPMGSITRHVHDAAGNQVALIEGLGTAAERTFRTQFDLNNRVVAEIDPTGARRRYTLDADGNRIRETDALGRVTRLYFDAQGRHTGTVDAERYYTQFVRDAMGNITEARSYAARVTPPADDLTPPTVADSAPRRTVRSTFDRVGNLLTQTGTGGDITEHAYSSTGKLLRITRRGTSHADEVARTWLPQPRVQTFAYDAADRMVRFVDVDGTLEQYTYDSANNKTSERITNPNPLAGGAADAVRLTTFEHDLDNRLVRQVFDPEGLALADTLAYDAAGNVVRRTDKQGNVSRVAYDLAHRQTQVTDALGGSVRYEHDAVGNVIAVTDPRGHRTELAYDAMGRVVQERGPEVQVYRVETHTVTTVRPTRTTVYDAVGNEVQLIDANGNLTTRWYDGNDNRIAELNGEHALRTYAYNAWDELVGVTEHLTRLGPEAHTPGVRPTPPGGRTRSVVSAYDDGGRVVRVSYPEVEITTVSALDGTTPTVTTSRQVTFEAKRYDRWGNLVESTDRRGARTVTYHDAKGRAVANIDPAGILTEFAYDGQGNTVRQSRWATPLAMTGASAVAAGQRPVPLGAAVEVIDRTYDAASRLLSELSPAVQTAGGPQRVLTTYRYDRNGNVTRRTLAANTTAPAVEYRWYDALNRLVATVDAARALVRYDHDANGNLVSVRRSHTAVPDTLNLAQADFDELMAAVQADAQDQQRDLAYDAHNRESEQRDRMGPGEADDIVVRTEYDALGNVTRRTDALGFATRTRYNAVNLASQVCTPDGNSTWFEYDTAGLRTRAWSTDLASSTLLAASDVGVEGAGGTSLRITYRVSLDGGLASWVVLDTVARDLPEAYAARSAEGAADPTRSVLGVTVDAAAHAPGTTLYMRVVTRDAAGNLAWTDERQWVVPAAGSTAPVASTVTTSAAGSARRAADGSEIMVYVAETEYDDLGAKVATNEDTGLWRRLGVDAMGNVVLTALHGTRAAEAAGLAPILTYAAYDARGLQTVTQGAIVAVDRDGDGSVSGAADGFEGAVVRNTHDHAGRLVQRTGSGVSTMQWTYDATGNLVTETNALGESVRHAYDALGRETQRTDARGQVTTKAYDVAGRLVSETDGAGRITRHVRDTYGRLLRKEDALGRATTYTYDQLDRLVAMTDAAGGVTRFVLDARGDRRWTLDANGHWFGTRYDAMRRVVGQYSFQDANPGSLEQAEAWLLPNTSQYFSNLVSTGYAYDVFGNKTVQVNANRDARRMRYAAFGRLVELVDEDGGIFTSTHDRFGRLVRERQLFARKDVQRSWDDANRQQSVVDAALGVSTVYTYDATGLVRHEKLVGEYFAPAALNGTQVDMTYTYDALQRLVQWSDAATGLSSTKAYDAAGNVVRVTGSNGVDHRYAYDASDRLLTVADGTVVRITYTYDAVGNRSTYTQGGVSRTYTYDALDRVVRAQGSDGIVATWGYDAVGNVLRYDEVSGPRGNVLTYARTAAYNESNRTTFVSVDDLRADHGTDWTRTSTGYELDLAGRVIMSSVSNEDGTAVYGHTYTRSGREVAVFGEQGASRGNSSSSYDANGRLNGVGLGPRQENGSYFERKFFYHDNNGQILKREHLGNEDGELYTLTRYVYALGAPVAEIAPTRFSNTPTITIDSGAYGVVEQFDEDLPGSSVTQHEVQSGETLRSVAALVYGNPSLWYLIADANGLAGDEDPAVGMRLTIPNRIELGRITHETQAVYDESAIIGSRLPNLQAPPPPQPDRCAAIGAIIGVIFLAIIGVIATIVTLGLAAPAIAAAVGAVAGTVAGLVAGLLVGAAIGAVIGFGVSAATQGILVGAGLQKEFDWTQVIADTAVAFVSGGLAALGELIAAGVTIGRVAKLAATVASTVLEAAGETARQAIVNPDHRPDNPLSIVLAGVGGAFGSIAAVARRAAKLQSTTRVALAVQRDGLGDDALKIASGARRTIRKLQDGTKIVRTVDENGTSVYRQVSRTSRLTANAGRVDRVLDVVTPKPGWRQMRSYSPELKAIVKAQAVARPVNTLSLIAGDVDVVRSMSFGERAAAVLTDAFGPRVGGRLAKIGHAIGGDGPLVMNVRRTVLPVTLDAAAGVAPLAGGKARQALIQVGRGFQRVGLGVRDAVVNQLDPLTLPFVLAKAGASLGRSATRGEGAEGRQRARYLRTDNGLAGPTRVDVGVQGPAFGVGKAIKGLFTTERRFRPQYQAPRWEDNAAATTNRVYSGFGADRALDLKAINALNELRLGRLASADRGLRDDWAAAVYGQMSSPADAVPVAWLDADAPSPRLLMEG